MSYDLNKTQKVDLEAMEDNGLYLIRLMDGKTETVIFQKSTRTLREYVDNNNEIKKTSFNNYVYHDIMKCFLPLNSDVGILSMSVMKLEPIQ